MEREEFKFLEMLRSRTNHKKNKRRESERGNIRGVLNRINAFFF